VQIFVTDVKSEVVMGSF